VFISCRVILGDVFANCGGDSGAQEITRGNKYAWGCFYELQGDSSIQEITGGDKHRWGAVEEIVARHEDRQRDAHSERHVTQRTLMSPDVWLCWAPPKKIAKSWQV
jgi:hypothetical protein